MRSPGLEWKVQTLGHSTMSSPGKKKQRRLTRGNETEGEKPEEWGVKSKWRKYINMEMSNSKMKTDKR
jgi:hypothetical protein